MCIRDSPETMKLFADAVKASKTVVWNGPMGVFENPTLAAGTLAVAKAMAESDATTVIGGEMCIRDRCRTAPCTPVMSSSPVPPWAVCVPCATTRVSC